MREKPILRVAALMIIFLLSSGFPAAIAEPAPEYVVKVNRVVEIGGWGLVTVNDTYTILNNSTVLLSEVPVGIPRNLTAGFRYLAAVDEQNRVLAVERDLDSSSDIYWYEVSFAKALAKNETYTFTVTSLFTDTLRWAGEGYEYTFVTTPILGVGGGSENMTIIAGVESKMSFPPELNLTQTSDEERVKLHGYFAPIEPYATTPLVLRMVSVSQFLVEVPHASREIRFSEDGSIHITDMYDFENSGSSVSTIQLKLPQNASNVMAYDAIGPLWDTPQEGPDVSVGPRYSGGIGTNRTFSFTLKYEVNPQAYVKQAAQWGSNSCEFTLLSNVDYWVIDKIETTLVAPAGFNVRDISPSPSSTSGSSLDRTFEYELGNVTPYTDLSLSIEYSYPAFWSGTLLLLWIGLVELVAIVAFVILRVRRPAELKIPVPSEKLKQFVELYDGRTALRLELDRMSEDLARGALNKHEYRRRRKTVELRMGELDRALQPIKQDLKGFHPRYNEMILRMEKAEAEIDANKLGEDHFRSQYRAGRISKEAHDRALDDLRRRMDKARETIETSLVTLREEAR